MEIKIEPVVERDEIPDDVGRKKAVRIQTVGESNVMPAMEQEEE